MYYALNLDENGRILSATYPQYATPDMPIVEALPDGDAYEYRYVDGEFIHDPLPQEEPTEPATPTEPTTPTTPTDSSAIWDEIAKAIREGVLAVEQ